MEEIEELRAKAIASMASSANPSAARRSKSPKSREEGELSPSDDAAELPTCSIALPNAMLLEERLPTGLVDNHARAKSDCPTVKTLPSGSPSRANAQIRPSGSRNYSKNFKTVRVPFKSANTQSISWHGKGSDDNLVISFSDDDSGSNSDESKPAETTSRKDNIARANKSELPIASVPVLSRGLQGGPNRRKLVRKKGLVNPASNPSDLRNRLNSSRHLATSVEKDSLIPSQKPSTKTPARQEHSHVPDPNVADHRLASLRHEIALRENELKIQSKSMPQSNEKNAGSGSDNHGPHTMLLATKAAGIIRPPSVAGIGLAPREQMMKRLKPAGINSKQISCSQFPLPSSKSAHECSLQLVENCDYLQKGYTMESHNNNNDKRQHAANTLVSSGVLLKSKDSGSLVPGPVTTCSPPVVSSKHENHSKMFADVCRSCDQSDKRDMAVDCPVVVGQNSFVSQPDANIEDSSLRKSNVSLQRNLSKEHSIHSNISRRIETSSLLPSKAPGDNGITRTRQIVATTGAQVPLETSSHIFERRSGQVPERKSVNNENTSLLNHSSQINITGEVRINLQSLVELEDLQDKELEEAQELRRRCELEERHALKAYRKAQRALIDANEKCSLLYRKRELFSAQLRALLMQASSSMWPSSWQSHGGTVSESVETVPDAGFDLLSRLGHQLPVEGQVLSQLGYESNTRHSVDARPGSSALQLNGHDFLSDQCLEQDASTSDHRGNSALDDVLNPAHRPNMSTDDEENYPSDHRPGEFQLTWNIPEGNHGQITADMNEPERLPSDENAQDYELLEASLRSKLVKRLGERLSCKSNKTGEAECLVEEGADKSGINTKSLCLPDQQMQEGEETETLDLEGVGILGGSSNQLTAGSQPRDNGFSLTDGALRDRDSQDNSFSLAELHMPNQTTGCTVPSSVMHVASGYAKSILLGCSSELSNTGEKEAILLEKFTECVADGESTALCSMGFARIGEMELHNYVLAIDPFWPFCMFELRGKCNNEECRWQHVKKCNLRNLKHDEHSATSFSDGQASHLLSVGNSVDAFGPPYGLFRHIMSIPTYHIGSNLIKVDSHLSQSLLARNMWQYWQRGFCASFSLPFSVQRILPPNAPFLQTGDGPVADDYSWNRLSLYYEALNGSMKQIVHGLPESEQSLEMALDLFDGSICKPDRKKALCMLSRAIEADSSSVVLWIVYLHIYYGKEKNIGKDDMFFHAVQHNESSYELWLMYINSRVQLGDRLNAYEYALTTFCRNENAFDKERRYISACILDIFLQMLDFLCMSGNVEKAIQKIFGLLENSGDTLLLDIHSCLIVSDRCIFWFCCIYLAIYRKLPELIVQQFEFEKELPFRIEWPSAHLTTDRKGHALELMKRAVDKMGLDIGINPHIKDQVVLRSLHFLAVSHVRCVAALDEGLHCSADLVASYLSLYPTCIELILISAHLKENCSKDLVFKGFEASLSNWPMESSGIQCLWHRYVEHVLADKGIDLAEILLARWFRKFSKDTNLHDWNLEGGKDGDSFVLPSHVTSDDGITCPKQDDTFWFLNLSLYKMLQKNLREARCAIDTALKLASHEDYKYCVRKHAAFTFAHEADSNRDKPLGVILGLLHGYLADSRSSTILEPLSRKYYKYIKRPRVRQFINNILGPVSRDFTLVNSVLEVCFGASLLPEKPDDPKGFVDFIESLMEITPANYKLALSVYKLTLNFFHPSVAANAIKFWACSLLINSIFQAVPVAPEHVWLEAADAMRDSEMMDISVRFHQQAVSVYPFSIKLWQSYMDICRNTDHVDTIAEAARERGVELS